MTDGSNAAHFKRTNKYEICNVIIIDETASNICRRRGRDLQRVRQGLLHPEDARQAQTEEAALGVNSFVGPKMSTLSNISVNCSCSICEILFDSSMLLEHHKDAYDHWSDADISESEDEDDVYRGDCYYTDCDGGRS